MLTVQNIHMTKEESGDNFKPLQFRFETDKFSKLTTEIDGKECFITLIGEKGLIPEAVTEQASKRKLMLHPGLISNMRYKVDLDVNSKGILVLRKRAVKIFDDSSFIFKFRVPEENFSIQSINKYTNTTNVRYMRFSEDRKECLVYLSYRTLFIIEKMEKEKMKHAAQFVNHKLDGCLQIVMKDENGKLFEQKISPIFQFDKCLNETGEEVKSVPVEYKMNESFNNMIIKEKSFELLKGFNSIKEDFYSINNIETFNPTKEMLTKDLTEVYGVRLDRKNVELALSKLRETNAKFRFYNIPSSGHIVLVGSNGIPSSVMNQDASLKTANRKTDLKSGVKLIIEDKSSADYKVYGEFKDELPQRKPRYRKNNKFNKSFNRKKSENEVSDRPERKHYNNRQDNNRGKRR